MHKMKNQRKFALGWLDLILLIALVFLMIKTFFMYNWWDLTAYLIVFLVIMMLKTRKKGKKR